MYWGGDRVTATEAEAEAVTKAEAVQDDQACGGAADLLHEEFACSRDSAADTAGPGDLACWGAADLEPRDLLACFLYSADSEAEP